MDILVNEERFRVEYPLDIWQNYDGTRRDVLMENIALSATLFLPQMLGVQDISYAMGRPVGEPYFFMNGMYDMPASALADGASSKEYVQSFFNTRRTFERNVVRTIPFRDSLRKGRRAIVPFSFGKESLLNYALAQELGLHPVLVAFSEPANTFEMQHKKTLALEFTKRTGTPVHVVHYGPGMMRSGKFFGLTTELGWGLQTTEYCLMCLPFLHAFDADTIVLGNEHSCMDTISDREGMLVYESAYDQHPEWTPHQSALVSLLLGRTVTVTSFVEPLYELAIAHILHSRYPEIGSFQMSCLANCENARSQRWCQHCEKCGFMFALAAAIGLDPRSLGFTENLFDEEHRQVYASFFDYDPLKLPYSSQEELGLAFLLALKRGFHGVSIDRFSRNLAQRFQKEEPHLMKKYFSIHSAKNIPQDLEPALRKVYEACLNGKLHEQRSSVRIQKP